MKSLSFPMCALIALLFFTPFYLQAQSTLESGQSLRTGQTLKSPNGQYALKFQKDGNLAFYGPKGKYIWDAGTYKKGVKLVMENDGHLVIYDKDNKDVWHTENQENYNGKIRIREWKSIRLEVTNEGKFRLVTAAHEPVFSVPDGIGKAVGGKNEYTRPLYDKMIAGNRLEKGQELASSDGSVVLRMQHDGNLAMYKNNKYLWDAKTVHRGHYLTLQSDGNLVIYDQNNNALWSSKTHPYFNAKYRDPAMKPVELNLLNDGTFILVNSPGRTMWMAPRDAR